jgi:hypothetical protein
MLIKMREMSPIALTRKRGEEAFDALESSLRSDQVEIDLEGMDMLSRSFLDGFVSRLSTVNKLNDVVFVTTQRDVLTKLGKISAQHGLVLFFRERVGDNRRQRVAPVPDMPAEMKSAGPVYSKV